MVNLLDERYDRDAVDMGFITRDEFSNSGAQEESQMNRSMHLIYSIETYTFRRAMVELRPLRRDMLSDNRLNRIISIVTHLSWSERHNFTHQSHTLLLCGIRVWGHSCKVSPRGFNWVKIPEGRPSYRCLLYSQHSTRWRGGRLSLSMTILKECGSEYVKRRRWMLSRWWWSPGFMRKAAKISRCYTRVRLKVRLSASASRT